MGLIPTVSFLGSNGAGTCWTHFHTAGRSGTGVPSKQNIECFRNKKCRLAATAVGISGLIVQRSALWFYFDLKWGFNSIWLKSHTYSQQTQLRIPPNDVSQWTQHRLKKRRVLYSGVKRLHNRSSKLHKTDWLIHSGHCTFTISFCWC